MKKNIFLILTLAFFCLPAKVLAVENWNGFNTIRTIENLVVERGVSQETIALLLLLPLVATLVSVFHYVLGWSGYGIFMPTMIAVSLLATGISGGLFLFGVILLVSLLCNKILKKFKLHFWPARSINLMFISITVFVLMAVSSYLNLFDVRRITIFPVLFMILLVEEFVRTQLVRSRTEANKLTLGTLFLAILGAVVMSFGQIKEWVFLNPDLTILLVIVINIVVGNYKGIRLTEIKRFKKAIRK
jgi:hypothetical protein